MPQHVMDVPYIGGPFEGLGYYVAIGCQWPHEVRVPYYPKGKFANALYCLIVTTDAKNKSIIAQYHYQHDEFLG